VIAASSNGGGYANKFQQQEPTFNSGGILSSVLAELWDFDTRISQKRGPDGIHYVAAPEDYLQSLTSPKKPIRGYYQGLSHSPDAIFAVTLDDSRWQNYYSHAIPTEIPPLPPGPYNDTNLSGDTQHSSDCTHHLIRDFMFLDAAVNNNITLVSSLPSAWPSGKSPYKVVKRDLELSSDEEYVSNYTQGTVPHSGSYYLLDDSSFAPDNPTNKLIFESRPVGFTALLYELQDDSGNPASVVPNWFGVAVPDAITDFRNVIIYFHPFPGQANYVSDDYATKSGKQGVRTNWKELFAYVERLGKQLAGAAAYSDSSNQLQNQIAIVPFMRDYDNVGIFPQYWSFIVRDILDDLYKNRSTFPASP
jgi:hypothetical protein